MPAQVTSTDVYVQTNDSIRASRTAVEGQAATTSACFGSEINTAPWSSGGSKAAERARKKQRRPDSARRAMTAAEGVVVASRRESGAGDDSGPAQCAATQAQRRAGSSERPCGRRQKRKALRSEAGGRGTAGGEG